MSDNRIPYLIIGGGHQGIAMAAHFALNGEKVYLWNRTPDHIKCIYDNHRIMCKGVVEGCAYIDKVSSDINKVISSTIFVTTPSTAHCDIAKMLAGLVDNDSVIFLNPGRTFGAIEFRKVLLENGCKVNPVIVETQSIVYTCRKESEDVSNIYALKDNVKMAAVGMPVDKKAIINRIPQCIRKRFTFVDSVLETSLGNVGMILHCAPVIMNAGWIESDKHEFRYYYDGISRTIGRILEEIDMERVAVAKKMGITTPSLIEWFSDAYGVYGDSVYECIQNNDYYREIDAPKTLAHRYLDEDVPNGLVPVEYLGKDLGVNVDTITLIINMAILIRKVDYRCSGRKFNAKEIEEYGCK